MMKGGHVQTNQWQYIIIIISKIGHANSTDPTDPIF